MTGSRSKRRSRSSVISSGDGIGPVRNDCTGVRSHFASPALCLLHAECPQQKNKTYRNNPLKLSSNTHANNLRSKLNELQSDKQCIALT